MFQTGRKRYLQNPTGAYREWAVMPFVLHMTLPSISYITGDIFSLLPVQFDTQGTFVHLLKYDF